MPEFKAREAARQAAKEAELAPYIAAALARRGPIPVMDDADIPTVTAFGKTIAEGKGVYGSATPQAKGEATHHAAGGVAMFANDYAEETKESAKKKASEEKGEIGRAHV